jgi:hypothetical protein
MKSYGGTRRRTNHVEEVSLNEIHFKETTIQHRKPGPDLESTAWENETQDVQEKSGRHT